MRPLDGPLMAGLVAFTVAMSVAPAIAQEQSGPFGGFSHDSSAPIEITSDTLEVQQAQHLAIFSGDVVAGQGTLRLTADRLEVTYAGQDQNDQGSGKDSGEAAGTGVIREMVAIGNVFISNGNETAQGEKARYDLESGIITMTGEVVLTQGQNVISGQELTINLDTGQGKVEGRVKSIFQPSDSGSK